MARSQALQPRESTLFFSFAFEKPIHADHVQSLAENEDGTAKYNTLAPLVQKVIEALNFSEESLRKLKGKFYDFKKLNTKQDLDEQFMRLYECRQRGWPEEADIDNIEAVKYVYARGVVSNNEMHNRLWTLSLHSKWENETDYHEIMALLRDIESNYKGTSASNDYQNSAPKSDKMDCTNCERVEKLLNNIGIKSTEKSQDSSNKEVNAVTKNCRLPSCGKTIYSATTLLCVLLDSL